MTLFVSEDKTDSVKNLHSTLDSVETTAFTKIGPVLKNWKLSSNGEEANENEAGHPLPKDSQPSPKSYMSRRIRTSAPVAPIWLQAGQAVAVFLTMAWITYAAIYILALPGSVKSITSSPLTLGGILASVLAPIAMLWLCISTIQRRSDAHIYAQALKEELRGMLFPSEEQSKLISDDIHMLMRQASEMSASSRAAIKAIQRARAGLRTEIRDFSGVSQKAEFHIDRLADSLSKRSEELLSMTEVIEKQTGLIDQKAAKGIQSWENVSAEISEIGDEISELFGMGAEKITAASSLAGEQVEKIGSALENSAEQVAVRMDAVADKIGQTQNRIGTDVEQLEKVSVAISSGAERLEGSLQGAERISSAVEGVMDVMSGSLEKVETTSRELFERTEHIEQKLSERADNLKLSAEQLLGSTNELEKVGDLAKHKLGEALTMAISGADTISASVRRSKEIIDKTVNEASGQIENSSRLVGEKMDAMMQSARDNRDGVAELLQTIDEKHNRLHQVTGQLEKQRVLTVDSINSVTDSLDIVTKSLAQRTEEPISLISRSVDRLTEQTQDFDEKLSIRVVELEQSQNKLRGAVDSIGSTLKASLQETATVTEHVVAQSKQVNEHIDAQKRDWNELVDELERRSVEIAGLLRGQSQELTDYLNISETQIGLLGQALFDRGDHLLERVSDVTGEVSEMEIKITSALEVIDRKTTEAGESIHSNVEKISGLAEKTAPDCERLVEAAEALEAKYAALRENYVSSSEAAVTCLSDIGQQLDDRLERLNAGVVEGSKSMLEMSEDLGSSMIEIRQAAESAQDSLSLVQNGVKGRIDDLQLVTDQVKAKVETLQKNLDVYIQDIAEVVGKATGDLQEATELFGQSTDLLGEKAENTTRKIGESSKIYIEEGQRMSLFAEQATHKTARIVSVVRDETERLIESVQKSLVELQKSGETLAVRTQEIDVYMKSSLENADTYSHELRAQAMLLATSSVDVVDQIANATAKLTSRASEVRQAGLSVTENIEVSRQKLSDESVRMVAVTGKAVEAAEEAATVFSRNSATLYRSVQEIAEQAKKLKDTQLRSEREAFLAASKFVIESLYSLAVDVSRHMEDEIDARVLRAYQRGDVAAFAKHLVEIAYKIPLEKSQKKFIDDSEFRTYILRFIRQYEEILTQSQANDYGELLSSLFSTSDIGKLYKLLCEIAGRSAKTH